MRFGRRLFVVVALVGAGLTAAPGGAGAEPAGCVMLVQQAEGWIATPDRYMEEPRRGDFRRNEPLTVYAEVDHFEVVTDQSTADGAALTQTLVPVYRSMTLGGLLMQMRNARLSPEQRGQVAPAWSAIAAAWDAWAGGDSSKPVPFEAARSILVDAEVRCTA